MIPTSPSLATLGNFFGPDTLIIFLIIGLFTLGFPGRKMADICRHESDPDDQKLLWMIIILGVALGLFITFFAR
jgi:hypothetical protein